MGRVAIIGVGQTAFVRGFPGSIRELAFDHMVENGLADSRKGKTISNSEMRRRIKLWQK